MESGNKKRASVWKARLEEQIDKFLLRVKDIMVAGDLHPAYHNIDNLKSFFGLPHNKEKCDFTVMGEQLVTNRGLWYSAMDAYAHEENGSLGQIEAHTAAAWMGFFEYVLGEEDDKVKVALLVMSESTPHIVMRRFWGF